MSAISVLSHEYQTASDLAQAVNTALVVLKKARLGLPGAPAAVESSRRQLTLTIETLISLLTPTAARPRADQHTLARVPGALVTHLQATQQDDLPYYVQALEQLLGQLRQGVAALTDLDLERLDQLAAATDAVASSVFRHLMRA